MGTSKNEGPALNFGRQALPFWDITSNLDIIFILFATLRANGNSYSNFFPFSIAAFITYSMSTIQNFTTSHIPFFNTNRTSQYLLFFASRASTSCWYFLNTFAAHTSTIKMNAFIFFFTDYLLNLNYLL